jgi:tetratricopeptide (TPR) repeat protein
MRESLALFTALAEHNPNLAAQQQAGTAHIKLGDLLGHPRFSDQNDRAGALDQYRQALAIYSALQPPDDRVTQRYLGILYERIGKLQELEKRLDDALASYRRSFAIREALANRDPANANSRRDLAIAKEKLGDVFAATGQRKEALNYYRAALPILESLYAIDPSNANAGRALAIEHEKIGDFTGDAREYREALRIDRNIAAADQANARIRDDLTRLMRKTGP